MTEIVPPTLEETNNSLTSFTQQISGLPFANSGGAQASQTTTLRYNNRNYLVTMEQYTLSSMYVEHGVVQALIDLPVDDAFRSGFEIRTDDLDHQDQQDLWTFIKRNKIIQKIQQAIRWGRLFGGSGLIILTDQDPMTPMNWSKVTENTQLDFKPVTRWELNRTLTATEISNEADYIDTEFFYYFGRAIHKSRVITFKGKEAPPMLANRLNGWGMSEVERLVRSINQYLKNQDVTFELLDEAKIDIFKIAGFNQALRNSPDTDAIAKRLMMANANKNYLNGLAMDAEDDWDHKQINFTGMSEVLTQLRQGIAADLRIPMTKLFGISAAGFNSGEDDIENYNGMIESEIRAKVEHILIDVVSIICFKLFGNAPEDLNIAWNTLRIEKPETEEKNKTVIFGRLKQTYDAGLIDDKEFKQAVNKAGLLPIQINENTPAIERAEPDEDNNG